MDNIKDLIMSYDEYAQLKSVSSPKVLTIKKDKQCLYYYGASHVNEPDHPMFPHIEEFWNEFILQIKDKGLALAINEGGLKRELQDRREAIAHYGETGFLNYLATKDKIKITNIEPNRKEVDDELLKTFSKEEIQYYYFARVVAQFLRMKPGESFEEYIQKFLNMDREQSEWQGFEFTLENMKKIHTELFKDDFNLDEPGFYNTIVNPSRKETVINAVARGSSDYRDAFIVEKIVEYWKEGLSMFIVYGFSHAYRQEKALQTFLQ